MGIELVSQMIGPAVVFMRTLSGMHQMVIHSFLPVINISLKRKLCS